MSNLKYIKLFEAFESIKLTKTLGFIDKSSKSTFMSQLTAIAYKIDLPLSKYTDDYFQYLPFKKAINLNQTIEDEPCDATSISEFPSYAIPGQTCQGGRLKRLWGGRPRSVICPACDGTGIKKKTQFDIKWIKFWFNKDGKYVAITGTDGKVRPQVSTRTEFTLPDVSNIIETSQDINTYSSVTKINHHTDISKYPNGTFIKINIEGINVIGRIWKENSQSYIIQNSCNGGTPDFNAWQIYGRYSWNVSDGDYEGVPTILVPNDVEFSIDDKINPYTWNAPIDLRRFTLDNNRNMESYLADAHFAIVLDYLELKKSGFKTKRQVSIDRTSQKYGATALISDDQIKKANISRYIEIIGKNISISSDFSNMRNMVFRFFGFGNFGYYVLRGRHFGDFNNLLTNIYRFLKETNESDKIEYYNSIVNLIKYKSEANTEFNMDVAKSIKGFYKLSPSVKKVEMMKKIEELNKIIYNKFKSYKIECLEDLEVFYQKIESIRNVWKNSERFDKSKKIYYSIEKLSDEYRFNSFINDVPESSIDTIIDELDRFIKVIERI